MADRPILFSAPMIRALLDGRKTMTRRVLYPQPQPDMGFIGIYAPRLTAVFGYETPDADLKVSLRYMPGDRLWVREALDMGHGPYPLCTATYVADSYPVDLRAPHALAWVESRKRSAVPSIHMPRWASRITLTVTEVRVQRLQDISEADAVAEGAYRGKHSGRYADDYFTMAIAGIWFASARGWYADLWDRLNASRAPWASNPWVVAISFETTLGNIDAMREAA